MPNIAAQRIRTIVDHFLDQVGTVAMRYHEHWIKPFCDENGVRFTSGMGAWSFRKLDNSVNSMDWDTYIDSNLDKHRDNDDDNNWEGWRPPKGYEELRDLLTLEVMHMELFEFMQDYTPDVG